MIRKLEHMGAGTDSKAELDISESYLDEVSKVRAISMTYY
jgi:hypothetical protein